jgi:hypothetical protein
VRIAQGEKRNGESQASPAAAARFEPGAAGARLEAQLDVEVRRREQAMRPLRPFDRAQRLAVEVFPKARLLPFFFVFQPIEIKVIEV